jgi:hypothetical protein
MVSNDSEVDSEEENQGEVSLPKQTVRLYTIDMLPISIQLDVLIVSPTSPCDLATTDKEILED